MPYNSLLLTSFWHNNVFLLWLRNKAKRKWITLHGPVEDDSVHGTAEVNVHFFLQHLEIVIQPVNSKYMDLMQSTKFLTHSESLFFKLINKVGCG